MKKRTVFPTSPIGRKLSRKSSSAIATAAREKPPTIFVAIPQADSWRPFRYVPARWRIKRGYVHLQWREGKKVKTWYIGKAKRSFPTNSDVGGPGQDQNLQQNVGKTEVV
jgi:hypothetical protein